MPFTQNLVHHPRRLMLRKALFQVHLWMGIVLSVYVAAIGLSGSILVFEDEIHAHAGRDLHVDSAHLAPPQQVFEIARKAYPRDTATYLLWPSDHIPAYTVYLQDGRNGSRALLADATDGHLLALKPPRFIEMVHDFHVSLLMGRSGFVLNCLGGIALLLLGLSGAMLWWPGLRLWTRGLRINLRANWKRIAYDTHNFVGICTLLIVSFWGASCVRFLWPAQTAAVVGWVSPLRGMQEPTLAVPHTERETAQLVAGNPANLAAVLQQAMRLSPGGFLSGVSLPAQSAGVFVVNIDTAASGDYSHRDIHTFDAATGQLLSTWHYGRNQTLGDWLLWIVEPLHFGTLWGLPVKILWSLLGLSLPILSLTGLLMYWNRFLGKRWAALRNPPELTHP